MDFYYYNTNVSVLFGKTLKAVEQRDNYGDELWFITEDNEEYKLYHEQDCCEHVYIESIVGDLKDLVGSPILLAEEVVHCDSDEDCPQHLKDEEYYESCTWTFYKFATLKGYVDIRWCGSSNGYYSESVDFSKVK